MEQKRLGYGWMRLPLLDPNHKDSVDIERASALADEFIRRGFTYFDTGYMYHEYESENVLRRCVVERHPRDSYTVADKMPMVNLKEQEDQVRIFDEQLRKTGLEYFDYYLLHNLNSRACEKAKRFDTINFLREKKKEGFIRKLGFSFHDTAELLEQILRENPDLEFVQLQINYLDWENEGIQSRKCYEVARKYGKPVIVMEPVKGGTLANNVPEKAQDLFRQAHSEWSVPSWAIRFAASLDGVMMVLSGMGDEDQLADNCSTMENFVPLTEEEQKVIVQARDMINDTIAIPCTGCRYCVEGGSCPQNILIPNYFSLYNVEQQDTNPSWSSQKEYYTNLVAQGYGKASDCIECLQCEAACPQHIPVARWLKKVGETFE
ncbi:MAG: aldo/keto reductase [Clostridiales bacterium]|nr:aldo/keto reductase [Clostridiales bacterium]